MVARGGGVDEVTMELAAASEHVTGARQCRICAVTRDAVADRPYAEFGVAGNGEVHDLVDRDGIIIGKAKFEFDQHHTGAAVDTEFMEVAGQLLEVAIENERTKHAYEQAAQRFASVAATIPGVVYQRRVSPDGDVRYTYISDGARDLFGVSPEEILADPGALFACHGPDYRATFRERLLKASRELTLWDVEAEIVTRDGQSKFTHAIARPHREADGSVLWNGVILDATRMKKAKRQLRVAKEAAEAANNAKSDFLANMSHELRTPLNAIIGFSEIMKTEMFGHLGHEAYKGYADCINDSGTHLLELVNDILDLSKVAAGEARVYDDDVDIRNLIVLCTKLVTESVQAAELTLEVGDLSRLPTLRADETKMKQVLLNLLSNAIKFTPAGGRVAIGAARTREGGVEISIADNGIGIDPARIPHVLEPFKQIEGAMARKRGGTGLGLPLVAALVDLHGGKFVLTSKLGGGTSAKIILPASRILARKAA